jgi:tetratricopeptide (TPR) repeat protein
MADKKTEIVYTPEEQAEIDRIIGVVAGEEIEPGEITPQPVSSASETNADNDNYNDIESFDIEDNQEPILEDEAPSSDDDFQDMSISDTGADEIPETEESPVEDEEDILPLGDADLSFIEDEEETPFNDEDDLPDIEQGREPEDLDTFEDIEEIPDIDIDLDADSGVETESVSIDGEDIPDIPDLDSLEINESADIPEAEDIELPDIDFDDLDKDGSGAVEPAPADENEDEFESFEDLDIDSQAGEISPLDDLDTFDEDTFDDIPDLSDTTEDMEQNLADSAEIEEIDDEADTIEPENIDDDILTIEPLDEDDITDMPYSAEEPEGGGHDSESQEFELSAKDLARLKKAMLLFNPATRDAIKDTVINDLIPVADTRKLVEMILTGKPEDNIHKFLEKKLKKKITPVDEASISGRRVITSRPEYTMEGRERQKRLLKLTKIFSAAALAAFFITILSYQYIYKPMMAKKLINRGVEIITQSGLSGGRFERRSKYNEAEKIFDQVEQDYIKNFLYGYNEYARAYLENSDYQESLDKLNKAYIIDKTNINTLNNLGYFYAKVNREYFNSLRGNIKSWYFSEQDDDIAVKSSLDLAINFYRRTLLIDKKNVTAMLGIGNAYFYQGQYAQAKKYYEDILKVDKNSVIGYSGLLNLYVERDSFPMVATLHAQIREKNMLPDLPSPLLSKLAGYYLDKSAKDDSNIRIDYGVTTPRIKDAEDNAYPAVLEVLKALNSRDPDYPQLHIQYARFNMAQSNLTVMKRYLEKALKLSPEYFSALHLTGVYHYSTREPVLAYRYLKSAADSYGRQPAFTREDFYRETEKIGETNAYLGHIFYYYFDRVKSRKGALDDEIIENEAEKLANYAIAEQYYTTAANQDYNSPELNYNLGRIYYLKENYTMALDRWLHLYDDSVNSPEIMMSIGNAFYHKGNYDSAKGEYLKLVSVLEYEADKIKNADSGQGRHVRIFQTLSSAYNNLGAVYQNLNDAPKRDLAYWKSIDYMQRLNRENEHARVNMARSHRDAKPLLDENIPFSIDVFSEEMRGI